jgi:hypothetical protein
MGNNGVVDPRGYVAAAAAAAAANCVIRKNELDRRDVNTQIPGI